MATQNLNLNVLDAAKKWMGAEDYGHVKKVLLLAADYFKKDGEKAAVFDTILSCVPDIAKKNPGAAINLLEFSNKHFADNDDKMEKVVNAALPLIDEFYKDLDFTHSIAHTAFQIAASRHKAKDPAVREVWDDHDRARIGFTVAADKAKGVPAYAVSLPALMDGYYLNIKDKDGKTQIYYKGIKKESEEFLEDASAEWPRSSVGLNMVKVLRAFPA